MFNPIQPNYHDDPGQASRVDLGYALDRTHEAAPQVSLITPFFNTGAVFWETVRSVQRQTFVDLEWLIIDDASTDAEALELLSQFEELGDLRFRVVRSEKNRGPSAIRNLGINEAQSEMIAFLDSDDLLEPTALEKWLWFLNTQWEFSFVNAEVVGFDAMAYHWTEGFHTHDKLFERNLANPIGMYRRSFLESVGGYDESIKDGYEDWDFWMKSASKGFWGKTLPDPLIWYRRRGEKHDDRWADFDGEERSNAFREGIIKKYGHLQESGFPSPQMDLGSMAPTKVDIPVSNPIDVERSSETKNILFILPHVEMGGSDKYTLDLAKGLAEKGHSLTVATTLGKEGGSWLHEMEAITPDTFVLGRFLAHSDYPRFLVYLVQSRQIDTICVSHSMLGYQLLPYLRKYLPTVLLTDYLHIDMPNWKSGGYPRFNVQYHDFLDATAVSSEHLKNWLTERGGNPNKINVVYTNIDPSHWSRNEIEREEICSEFGLDADAKLILFAGRLTPQKQPKLLMEVALELAKSVDEKFQLVVAGDGEDGDWVRFFAEKNREALQDRIVLLGEVSNERVKDLLGVSDVFFLPSENEGIALSLFEAMSMECAVVGADVGGQIELVADDCGTLIERESFTQEKEAYLVALKFYLENPNELISARKKGRLRILDSFTLDHMIAGMESLFNSSIVTSSASLASLDLHTAEICEQARLEDESSALWKLSQKQRSQIETQKKKLEDFRGMKKRRDEKIKKLEDRLKISDSPKKGFIKKLLS